MTTQHRHGHHGDLFPAISYPGCVEHFPSLSLGDTPASGSLSLIASLNLPLTSGSERMPPLLLMLLLLLPPPVSTQVRRPTQSSGLSQLADECEGERQRENEAWCRMMMEDEGGFATW
ncbi:hypothetical protein E2C01_068766 [Portunus trituberculatus]|uniref:Uncharacterized protein n=1 Tax=Portunus trituberculatus TaxID=210409 RepID=A0A5B7I0F0_PORTR|nr:hypothetical protein [Portunus trituberculatus]